MSIRNRIGDETVLPSCQHVYGNGARKGGCFASVFSQCKPGPRLYYPFARSW